MQDAFLKSESGRLHNASWPGAKDAESVIEKESERGSSEAQERSSESNVSTKSKKSIFDELPGTREGKAALIDFELGDMDIVEEQVCFDFGQDFESQSAPQTITTSVVAAAVSALVESAVEVPQDQLDFVDAEEKALALAEETVAALEDTSIEDDGLDESDAAFEGNFEEMGALESKPLRLDEGALPDLPIVTDDDLMKSIQAIPEKMAFKIGEVADMIGVKQYVLRYWESEFDALRPRKSRNGQRIYTRKDVETTMMIRKLLYTDRFSIEGARAALKQLKGRVREEKQWSRVVTSHEKIGQSLKSLLTEIRRIREVLA